MPAYLKKYRLAKIAVMATACLALMSLALPAMTDGALAGRYRKPPPKQEKPLKIDKTGIIQQLRLSRFASLEKMYGQLLDNHQFAKPSDKTNTEKRLVLAFSAFQHGDPTLTPQYNRWVHHSPGKVTPRLARAIHYWRLGWFVRGTGWASETSRKSFAEMERYFRQASRDIDTVLEHSPGLPIAWGYRLNMANTLSPGNGLQKKRLEGLYYRAISLAPKSLFIPDNYFLRLQTRWGGSNDKIVTALNRLKLLRTNEAGVQYLFGFLNYSVGRNFLSSKKYRRALQAFEAAGQFGPSARYYRGQALAHYGLENYKKALIAISRASRLEKQSAENISLRARILWKLGQRNRALYYWEQAMALAPYDPDIAHWYGYALRKKGQFRKALSILARGQYFGRDNHEIHALQGNIQLYHTRNFRQASLSYARARQINPQKNRLLVW